MSKFLLFDFRCLSCDHVFEIFAKPDEIIPCLECSRETKRLISAPRIDLPGTDPAFPRAYDAWDKKRKTKAKEDKKFFDAHGVDKKHHSYGS